MRYATALTSALLLAGTAASLALQAPVSAQTAQNEPGAIAAAVPKAGAPMSFADMVAKLQPAVVNISTAQHIQVQADPFAGTPFGGVIGGGNAAPVTRQAQSLGSGFLISADGYVVTNNHVVAAGTTGAKVDSITVTLTDKREYKARLVGRDVASDLALLKIDAPGPLPFVRFGDSAHARVGDWVVAIGNPFGLGSTVTAGIISALHRVTGQGGAFDRFIQTDASINQGNSGGPMFDLNGNVIGINSQILSPTGGNVGIGFAIPAESAKPIIDQLRSGAAIKRGYLGVGIQPMDDDTASALGLPKDHGELIGRVEPKEAGEKAGIKVGDVVVRVNGQDVTPDQTLSYLVANIQPGARTTLDIIRDGKAISLPVVVGTRPSEETLAGFKPDNDDQGDDQDGSSGADQSNAPTNALGVAVTPLTPAIARSIGVDPSLTGAVITGVDPSSDAGQKGLKRGYVISRAGGVPVNNAADLARAIAAAKAAGRDSLLVLITAEQGATRFIPLKIKK